MSRVVIAVSQATAKTPEQNARLGPSKEDCCLLPQDTRAGCNDKRSQFIGPETDAPHSCSEHS